MHHRNTSVTVPQRSSNGHDPLPNRRKLGNALSINDLECFTQLRMAASHCWTTARVMQAVCRNQNWPEVLRQSLGEGLHFRSIAATTVTSMHHSVALCQQCRFKRYLPRKP